mmetsp:Transcript_54172/g.136302  ORF Transcript_54172/g.136302 Transcript_54172/m.136302 type:complete len:109 (-) Transcript_54172:59-385(-)
MIASLTNSLQTGCVWYVEGQWSVSPSNSVPSATTGRSQQPKGQVKQCREPLMAAVTILISDPEGLAINLSDADEPRELTGAAAGEDDCCSAGAAAGDNDCCSRAARFF